MQPANRLISYECNLSGAWVYHSYMATRAQVATARPSLQYMQKRGTVRGLRVKRID